MKAGTTTLYWDLMTHPSIFFPTDKEPGNLCHDHVLTLEGTAAYSALFRSAKPNQCCGEASTNYSKLPDYPGVAGRARQLIGSDLRVIYIIRDPIQRIISHHQHERAEGRNDVPDSIDEAVREIERFINYSRYAMQLQPWLETFGREQVHVICFEHYIHHRTETVNEVISFLGLQPSPHPIDTSTHYNAGERKPVLTPTWQHIVGNPIYRCLIRPLVSPELRNQARHLLLPRTKATRCAPAQDTIAYIHERLRDDLKQLRRITNAEAHWLKA